MSAPRSRWLFAVVLAGCGARSELRVEAPDAGLPPVAAPGLQIAPGRGHVCALRGDGAVVCWGDNLYGQRGAPAVAGEARAVLGDLGEVASIASFMDTTCVVLRGGQARCWGAAAGALAGDAGSPNRDRPTPVDGLTDAREIAVGYRFFLARRGDGSTRTWGDNANGNLGVGSYDPLPGIQTPSGLGLAVQVAASYEQSCAVLRDGQVSCWGPRLTDYAGRVGVLAPRLAPGVADATAVAVSLGTVCVIRRSGRVACWGYNRNGELGDGTTTDRPLPADVAGLSGVTQIRGGYGQFCALRGDGSLWCWGRNDDGECGVRGVTRVLTPAPVAGLPPARAVAGGWGVTCAITRDERAFCWGANASGQLGAGPSAANPTPTAVDLGG